MITPTWQAGDVQLYLGDCLEILPQLEAGSVDLTVTSPPYDNLRTYNGYTFNFEGIAQELFRVTKPGGVVVWVVGDATIDGSETGTSFRQALYFKEIGFNLHDTMIYEKNGAPFPDKTRYYNIFEFMFILSKGLPAKINLIEDRKNKWLNSWGVQSKRNSNGQLENYKRVNSNNVGVRFNIWRINTGKGFTTDDEYAYEHPAMFPEVLARDHILSWSNPGDTVLDPMMGSGTTGKMAEKNDRPFIGIEISNEYFDIAVKRIQQAQLQIRMDI